MAGKFVSAYDGYRADGNKHPAFTVVSDHRDCIDFIFHTEKDFLVTLVLQLPSEEEVHPWLPNRFFPSDHLRIEACLQFNDCEVRSPWLHYSQTLESTQLDN